MFFVPHVFHPFSHPLLHTPILPPWAILFRPISHRLRVFITHMEHRMFFPVPQWCCQSLWMLPTGAGLPGPPVEIVFQVDRFIFFERPLSPEPDSLTGHWESHKDSTVVPLPLYIRFPTNFLNSRLVTGRYLSRNRPWLPHAQVSLRGKRYRNPS